MHDLLTCSIRKADGVVGIDKSVVSPLISLNNIFLLPSKLLLLKTSLYPHPHIQTPLCYLYPVFPQSKRQSEPLLRKVGRILKF